MRNTGMTGFLCFLFAGIFLHALPSPMAFGQGSVPSAIIGADILLFTTDMSGNVYTVNSKHDITKYSPSGEKLFSNNFSMPGQAASIDARNPMLILVYYPDYLMVRMLDRTLSPLAELNLSDWDYYEVPCIAASNDNQLWIYDQGSFKVLKINMQGQVLSASPDLRQWTGLAFHAISLRERHNRLFLHDKKNGLLILDQFAQPEELFNPFEISDLQVHDGSLFLLPDRPDQTGGEKMLIKKNINTALLETFNPGVKINENTKFRIEKNHFYLLIEGKVYVYPR